MTSFLKNLIPQQKCQQYVRGETLTMPAFEILWNAVIVSIWDFLKYSQCQHFNFSHYLLTTPYYLTLFQIKCLPVYTPYIVLFSNKLELQI